MRKLLFINVCLTFLIIHILFSASASAYRTDVHEIISDHATGRSLKYHSVMKNIGLNQGKIKSKDLLWWVQHGSSWEDNFQFIWGDILFCHFHNPVTDQGYTLPSGTEFGQSLIARAHDAANEWSYEMAKKFYYAALAGDNNEIASIFSRIRDGIIANGSHSISSQTNMNKEDRDQYFAWTLQALGHTLHLVQDASVPAHTRNDFHGLFEPFEKWTYKNKEDLPYGDEGSSPWMYWSQHVDTLIPDVFIDTDQLDNNDAAPVSGSDQGIAEYSRANFMSEDTIFTFDLPLKPDWSDFYNNYQSDDFNLDVRQDMTFVYLRNKHPGGVDHLALAGVLHPYPISSDLIHDVRWTTNDRKVHEDYASKLIPRAVGYSAGLLDYFFRGEIDMVPAEENGDGYVIENNSEEELEGIFRLYYDNKSDQRIQIESGNFPLEITIPSGDKSSNINFTIPDADDPKEPGKYMLVFRGKLGNEEDAVIGKVVNLSSPYVVVGIGGIEDEPELCTIWNVKSNTKATDLFPEYPVLYSEFAIQWKDMMPLSPGGRMFNKSFAGETVLYRGEGDATSANTGCESLTNEYTDHGQVDVCRYIVEYCMPHCADDCLTCAECDSMSYFCSSLPSDPYLVAWREIMEEGVMKAF